MIKQNLHFYKESSRNENPSVSFFFFFYKKANIIRIHKTIEGNVNLKTEGNVKIITSNTFIISAHKEWEC